MPPRVRLTHDEVSKANLETPGITWGLLRKLNVHREQISRGKACKRCREKKLKCDAGAPCKNCTKAKLQCDAVPATVKMEEKSDDEIATIRPFELVVDRPVPKPFFGPVFSEAAVHRDLGNLYAPALNPFHHSLFALYGFRKDSIVQLLSHLPRKLQVVLGHLGAHLPPSMGQSLDMMPEKVDTWGDSSFICRQVIKMDQNHKYCAHNDKISHLAGAHQEELATRINNAELSMFTSEYRLLCMHLFFLWARMYGKKQVVHFMAMYPDFCRQTSTPPSVVLHRVTRNFYLDGVVSTGRQVTMEEYNEARRRFPEAIASEFLECSKEGSELTGSVLREQEQIRCMVGSEAGVRKLERLADKIVAKFQLHIPPHLLAPSPLLSPPSARVSDPPHVPANAPAVPLPHHRGLDSVPQPGFSLAQPGFTM